jgi:tetratricopeptide (TPR) repeat protein
MKGSQRVRRVSLVVAVLLASGGIRARVAWGDAEDAGRKHAARANQLAAKNKCRSALPEFNRAYKTLKDPTLLFNRAECLRKLGRDLDALKDYEQFLAEMPGTPNRATVESRIMALRGIPALGSRPALTEGKEPPKEHLAPAVSPAAKPAAAPAKESAAPPARPAEKPVAAPAPPPAKPAEKPVAAPAAPAAKPMEKAAAAAAKEPVPSAEKSPSAAQKVPTPPAARPSEKAPAEPARRAAKWTD